MARRSAQVQLIAFSLLALMVTTLGQGTSGCPSLSSYAPCLEFVHKDNKVPGYSDPCCVVIRSSSESCLYDTARTNGNAAGINLEKALTLPKACGRKVPANTYCGNMKVPN